jgi:predicted transcriptional regulator of viral defense system
MSAGASLAEVARRTPHAVVALLSALRFHGLTTQLPHGYGSISAARRGRPRARP